MHSVSPLLHLWDKNYGAKKSDRVYKGIRVCLGMCVLSSIVLSFLLYTFGSLVFLLFTTDQAVIAKGTQILRYLVPTFITYVCVEIYSGALRGAGDCWIPMILTSLGVCVLRIVWICTAVPIHPVIETVVFLLSPDVDGHLYTVPDILSLVQQVKKDRKNSLLLNIIPQYLLTIINKFFYTYNR